MLRSLPQAIADPGAAQTQPRELRRVRNVLAQPIFEWCESQLAFRLDFQMADLVYWVHRWMRDRGEPAPAPDSVSRILRDLRQSGAVSYRIMNRRQSLYRIDAIDASKL